MVQKKEICGLEGEAYRLRAAGGNWGYVKLVGKSGLMLLGGSDEAADAVVKSRGRKKREDSIGKPILIQQVTRAKHNA